MGISPHSMTTHSWTSACRCTSGRARIAKPLRPLTFLKSLSNSLSSDACPQCAALRTDLQLDSERGCLWILQRSEQPNCMFSNNSVLLFILIVPCRHCALFPSKHIIFYV